MREECVRFAHDSFERAAPLRCASLARSPGCPGVSGNERSEMPTGRKGQRVSFAHESYERAAPLRFAPLARSPRFRRSLPKRAAGDAGRTQDGRDKAFASLTSLSSVPHRSAGTLAQVSPESPGANDRGCGQEGRLDRRVLVRLPSNLKSENRRKMRYAETLHPKGLNKGINKVVK